MLPPGTASLRRRIVTLSLVMVAACARGPQTKPAPLPYGYRGPAPAPCVTDHHAYYPSDTLRGIRPASPIAGRTVRSSGAHGTAVVRMFVDPLGVVVPDSSKLIVHAGNALDREALQTAKSMRFFPAVNDKCAVSFWYQITLQR